MPKLTRQKDNRYWLHRRRAMMDTIGPSNARYMRLVDQLVSRNEQTHSAAVTLNYRSRNESLTTGSIAPVDRYVRYVKRMMHDNIEPYRRKVRRFARLSRGWDSHNAGPVSRGAIADALRLLDLLEKNHIVPNAAIPTSDESILIRYERGAETFKWEFSGQGEIAFVKTRMDGQREYVDVAPGFRKLPE